MNKQKEAQLQGLMRSAATEIRLLRRANELLNAKVEVMDLFACVLHTKPAHRSIGESVDIAWELEKEATGLASDNLMPAKNDG